MTWTYVGTHTQYNREHLKDDRVRGWFSYPVESQELLLDGATAVAAGVESSTGVSRVSFIYLSARRLSRLRERALREGDQALKAIGYESEPFLDWQMSPEMLARYQLIYASNAVCLSDSQISNGVARRGEVRRRLPLGSSTFFATAHGQWKLRYGLRYWLRPPVARLGVLRFDMTETRMLAHHRSVFRFHQSVVPVRYARVCSMSSSSSSGATL
ncbi:MAG TPA: hypothetical protein VFC21_04215 [Bryobacteraceae bacterium]|nr:hypothetical protein [Bryobacteraceae bacterium]